MYTRRGSKPVGLRQLPIDWSDNVALRDHDSLSRHGGGLVAGGPGLHVLLDGRWQVD